MYTLRFAIGTRARFLNGAAYGALALCLTAAASARADEPDGLAVASPLQTAQAQIHVSPPDLPEATVTFRTLDPEPLILPPDLPPVVVVFAPVSKAAPLPRPLSKAAQRLPAPVILPPDLPPVVVAFPAPPKLALPQPVAKAPFAAPAPAPLAAAPLTAPAAVPLALSAEQLAKDDLKLAAETFLRSELPQGLRAPQQAQQLRKEREALVAFYAARDFAPLWSAATKWNAAAQSAMQRVALGAGDGLDLAAYQLPRGEPLPGAAGALAELRLSEAVAAYARQASGSRVDPARLSSLISANRSVPDVAHALLAIAAAADAGAALLAYNPPHAEYRNLRAKLQDLRAAGKATGASLAAIPPGPPLRLGMRDPRVPLLRARLGTPASGADESVYDQLLAAAIMDFQRANSLPASGVLTPRTVAALGGGEPVKLENEIIANMERWRWMPRDMGADRIEVNIPDYAVNVFRANGLVHRTRAVVGKPDTPTPVFSEKMEYLIVNPSWNVPQSIIQKEMLPRLAADPDYLARQGYEVIQKGDTLIVRQPPGERNALGRIKFMFPNQHAVYLHDTPSRALFANEKRAFSHGCVRVDQPFKLAEAVMGAGSGWSEERVKALVGGAERTVYLPKPLPIHIMYFTAAADAAGAVQLKDDIYGYSRRVKAALGLEGEAYVETPRKPAHSALKIKPPHQAAEKRQAASTRAAPVAAAPLKIAPAAVAAAPPPPKPKSLFGWLIGQ